MVEVEEELNRIRDEIIALFRQYYRILNTEFKKAIDEVDPINMAKTYIFHKNAIKPIEEVFKHIEQLKNRIKEKELPEVFEARGITNQPIANLSKAVRYYARTFFTLKDKDKGFHWLRTHKLGSIIQLGVQHQTLNKVLNEYREASGEDPPEEFFSAFDKYTVSVHPIHASNTPRGGKKKDG